MPRPTSKAASPWQFPTWVFSREKERIASFSDLIGGNPTVSDDFSFTGPHTIKAVTREKAGSDKQIPVVVDLAAAIAKLPEPKWRAV